MHEFDWPTVHRRVTRADGQWVHLGDDLPWSLAVSLSRDNQVTADLEVKTRNTHYEQGKRFCSIYLRTEQ